MAEAVIDVAEVTHSIELRVKGLRAYSIRCAIAAKLFALGAWVAGVQLAIETAPAVQAEAARAEAGGGSKVQAP